MEIVASVGSVPSPGAFFNSLIGNTRQLEYGNEPGCKPALDYFLSRKKSPVAMAGEVAPIPEVVSQGFLG